MDNLMHTINHNTTHENNISASMSANVSDVNFGGNDPFVTKNPWQNLQHFTDARIGLGRAGVSAPTRELLAFQLAHARAQDAVHMDWDVCGFADKLLQETVIKKHINSDKNTHVLHLKSQALNREMYVQRPDYGRRLSPISVESLGAYYDAYQPSFDLAIVIADGLSARAIDENAINFLQVWLPLLHREFPNLSIAPISLVQQGRVAVGDEVGQQLRAACCLMLIGERPGLSSVNSMGAYLTWAPIQGCKDAQRNCISNIRKAGLSYSQAALKANYLFAEARKLGLSGVQIKDRTEDGSILADDSLPELPCYF